MAEFYSHRHQGIAGRSNVQHRILNEKKMAKQSYHLEEANRTVSISVMSIKIAWKKQK